MCRNLLLSLALVVSGMSLKAQLKMTAEDYIEKYKDIAVSEMERSGIPASITLAQGIHESAFGNSSLSVNGNNHFGIKCTRDWTGKRQYHWDDETVKSCFRVYGNAEESFIDHTDFLSQRKRYAFLFDLEPKNYEAWAKGLKKAGYATDPRYPQKLISTIERHDLSRFDSMKSLALAGNTTSENAESIVDFDSNAKRPLRKLQRSTLFSGYKKGIYRNNNASFVFAKEGESALALATRLGIPYSKFLKFNDLRDGDQIIDFQYAYIQPKKTSFKGSKEIHLIEKGETMYELSQFYGIKLEALCNKNRIDIHTELAVGETVFLKKTRQDKPKVRPSEPKKTIDINEEALAANLPQGSILSPDVEAQTPHQPIVEVAKKDKQKPVVKKNPVVVVKQNKAPEKPASNAPKKDKDGYINTAIAADDLSKASSEKPTTQWKATKDAVVSSKQPKAEKKQYETATLSSGLPSLGSIGHTQSTDSDNSDVHVVKPKETLYRISRIYGKSVDAIKSANGLVNNVISVNQELVIPD